MNNNSSTLEVFAQKFLSVQHKKRIYLKNLKAIPDIKKKHFDEYTKEEAELETLAHGVLNSNSRFTSYPMMAGR